MKKKVSIFVMTIALCFVNFLFVTIAEAASGPLPENIVIEKKDWEFEANETKVIFVYGDYSEEYVHDSYLTTFITERPYHLSQAYTYMEVSMTNMTLNYVPYKKYLDAGVTYNYNIYTSGDHDQDYGSVYKYTYRNFSPYKIKVSTKIGINYKYR